MHFWIYTCYVTFVNILEWMSTGAAAQAPKPWCRGARKAPSYSSVDAHLRTLKAKRHATMTRLGALFIGGGLLQVLALRSFSCGRNVKWSKTKKLQMNPKLVRLRGPQKNILIYKIYKIYRIYKYTKINIK